MEVEEYRQVLLLMTDGNVIHTDVELLVGIKLRLRSLILPVRNASVKARQYRKVMRQEQSF